MSATAEQSWHTPESGKTRLVCFGDNSGTVPITAGPKISIQACNTSCSFNFGSQTSKGTRTDYHSNQVQVCVIPRPSGGLSCCMVSSASRLLVEISHHTYSCQSRFCPSQTVSSATSQQGKERLQHLPAWMTKKSMAAGASTCLDVHPRKHPRAHALLHVSSSPAWT